MNSSYAWIKVFFPPWRFPVWQEKIIPLFGVLVDRRRDLAFEGEITQKCHHSLQRESWPEATTQGCSLTVGSVTASKKAAVVGVYFLLWPTDVEWQKAESQF